MILHCFIIVSTRISSTMGIMKAIINSFRVRCRLNPISILKVMHVTNDVVCTAYILFIPLRIWIIIKILIIICVDGQCRGVVIYTVSAISLELFLRICIEGEGGRAGSRNKTNIQDMAWHDQSDLVLFFAVLYMFVFVQLYCIWNFIVYNNVSKLYTWSLFIIISRHAIHIRM